MPHKSRAPLACQLRKFGRVGGDLLPEEAEAAVAFGVNFAAVTGFGGEVGKSEPLGDGGFHLCDGPCGRSVDVGRAAVATVHDEGAFVHAGLRSGDEVAVEGAAGPGSVDVGAGVKYAFEVFPFAGIAVGEGVLVRAVIRLGIVERIEYTGRQAIPQRAHAA